MVVRNDDGRRIALERELDDFAWVYAGAVDGAAEQFFEVNQAMPLVEIQAAEYLVLQVAQFRDQEIARGAGTG